MTTNSYMAGRKTFARPQGILWSDSRPTIIDGKYIPAGYEQLSNQIGLTNAELADSFIILSDHNRGEIDVRLQRLENRQRMVNGTMRSNYIADKLSISLSWTMLPSRSFAQRADFDQTTGKSDMTKTSLEYTVDGGAGGAELLKWYEDHIGPFWVFLSYDKYTNFGTDDSAYNNLAQYSQALEMYFSSFDYSVVKRGATNHDLWNISVTLEEV